MCPQNHWVTICCASTDLGMDQDLGLVVPNVVIRALAIQESAHPNI